MVWTKVGRPVGMEAIPVEMQSRRSVSSSCPRAMPMIGDDGHRRPGQDAEDLGQAVQLLLERRAGPLGRSDHVRDAAHLRGLPRVGDDERRRAPGHLRVLEDQIRPVTERDVPPGQGAGVLGHGRALSGEGGLLDLEGGRRDDPAVGRNEVAGLDQHHVAGDEVGRGDLLDRARSPDAGVRHLKLGEGLHAGLGLQLLVGAHDHVERDQPDHHQAGRHLADQEARHPDDQQHDVHRVRQLAPGDRPQARGRLLRQLVRSVGGEPLLHLAGVEALLGIHAEPGLAASAADRLYQAVCSVAVCSVMAMSGLCLP